MADQSGGWMARPTVPKRIVDFRNYAPHNSITINDKENEMTYQATLINGKWWTLAQLEAANRKGTK